MDSPAHHFEPELSRRRVLGLGAAGCIATATLADATAAPVSLTTSAPESSIKGDQRLSLARLQAWEALRYGMFIHFGMSTFTGDEMDKGHSPAERYAPDRLDVDQWVSVVRDAGMKYAVLTAKHHSGHCLWPSQYTAYSVKNSKDHTDVVAQFIDACRKKEIRPGLYYASLDHHHRFGSRSPLDDNTESATGDYNFPRLERMSNETNNVQLPAFVSSTYQDFQTAQLEELIQHYGPIMEIWIDTPHVLGRGFRHFLYHRITDLHPDAVIMMNSGIGNGTLFDPLDMWPSDLIAMEKALPPVNGHEKWRDVDGRLVYLPGEACSSVCDTWFNVEGSPALPDKSLLEMFHACRNGGVNYLLNVPPDVHGLIPREYVDALQRLRKAVKI